MINMVRYDRDPWSIFDELEALQEDMSRALADRGASRQDRRSQPGYPLMNVWSGHEGLLIDAELPGVETSAVDISVKGDVLKISGEMGAPTEETTHSYQRRERPYGAFTRTLQLPFRADADGVKATYSNGILRIAVPRSEEEKPRKIEIKAA